MRHSRSPRPLLLALLGLLLPVVAAVGPVRADEGRDALVALKKALRKGDPEARVAALRDVTRRARLFTAAERRSAAALVRKALEDERSPDVRARMITSLSRLGGATGWVPVILAWKEERDETVRAATRQALLWGGGDYLEVVARLLDEDEDPTFRATLLLLLGDRRRADATPILLARLADEHPRVASAAAEALEAISGEAFGYDAAAWGAWWDREQARRVQEGPAPDADGESETVAADPVILPEPRPHRTRSLVPDFYGLELRAKDIVFVLDISGSVGSSGVARAKRELVRAVESLGTDVNIAALFFDEQVHMWNPGMVRATPENKAELAHFLRGIEPGRKTDLFTPLNAGLQIVRRRLEEREASGEPIREAITMIVVSDGVETSRQTPPNVVADKLDRLDPEHTVVHAVALGPNPSALMLQLARLGGGHYVQAR